MSILKLDMSDEQSLLEVDQPMLRRTVEFVVDHFALSSATISLAIVDDDTIQELKGRYFGQCVVTDVISFNLLSVVSGEDEKEALDSEVVVNAKQAKREADEKQTDPQAELNLYVVHGLLHPLGFDDATEAQSKVMHQKEDELLEQLGLGKVFSGRNS